MHLNAPGMHLAKVHLIHVTDINTATDQARSGSAKRTTTSGPLCCDPDPMAFGRGSLHSRGDFVVATGAGAGDRRQQRRDDWIIEWIKASRRLGNRVNQGIETIVQSTLPRHRDDWVIELTNVNSIA